VRRTRRGKRRQRHDCTRRCRRRRCDRNRIRHRAYIHLPVADPTARTGQPRRPTTRRAPGGGGGGGGGQGTEAALRSDGARAGAVAAGADSQCSMPPTPVGVQLCTLVGGRWQ